MPTLALHPLQEHTPYLIGFFMVGAYQEILGDMHNLFGDTNAVNVVLDGKGGWQLADPDAGDRTDELLRYVHLEPEKLSAAYRRKLDATTLPAAQRDENGRASGRERGGQYVEIAVGAGSIKNK